MARLQNETAPEKRKKKTNRYEKGFEARKEIRKTIRNVSEMFLAPPQWALRDRLMSRGKNCLPTVSRQFLTRNYPRPNCLLKCLPNCLSPTREGFLSSFKINPAVRVIARQVRGKNCLAAIFAPRHQSVSSGPLGLRQLRNIETGSPQGPAGSGHADKLFRGDFWGQKGVPNGHPKNLEMLGILEIPPVKRPL